MIDPDDDSAHPAKEGGGGPGRGPDEETSVGRAGGRSSTRDSEDESRDVATQIEEIPAADGADVLETMTADAAADVAEYLDPETAGAILSEMEPSLAASVLSDMEAPEASMVVSAMDPDDAVDVLEHVPAAQHKAILDEMDAAEAEEVRELEKYPPDTAGGIMTPHVTSLPEGLSVEQAITELRRFNEEREQMFYVYVVDRRNHLIGVLSMRDLILARPDRSISTIMRPNVASVPATMDQEHVAREMRRKGFLAMPVVDARNRLIGIVTFDDMADVMEEEATEDVQKMFGAGAEERLTSPWQYSFKKRVWWLQVNLLTAFMAAAVVGMFQETIAALPILAAYQTIVSGMGGNAGAQSMAVAIRGIALGEVNRRLLGRILYREAIVGLLTGVVIGVITAAIATIFHYHEHGLALGVVIAAALTINHFLACTTGVIIPFTMKWLGFDPAQSATIFATTVTDCCGFFATLGLANMFMGFLK